MLGLKSSWKFVDIQENIEALITQFEGELMPFLCTNLKQNNIKLHQMKLEVFEYNNIMYWQRERLWEVLNGDMEIEDFRRL